MTKDVEPNTIVGGVPAKVIKNRDKRQINRNLSVKMEKILKVHHVNDYARYIGAPELHPLVSVKHYEAVWC